jgi:hypothetical protein
MDEKEPANQRGKPKELRAWRYLRPRAGEAKPLEIAGIGFIYGNTFTYRNIFVDAPKQF